MNKKKLVTTLGSLALVGAIGVGATLAFLSDTDNQVSNTFTMGSNLEIILNEAPWNNTTKTADHNAPRVLGNEYEDLVSDELLAKDPQVTIVNDTKDQYVFMAVKTSNDVALGTTSSNWILVDDYQAPEDVTIPSNVLIYAYNYNGHDYFESATKTAQDNYDNDNEETVYTKTGTQLPPLFQNVTVNHTTNAGATLDSIKVRAASVQKTGFDDQKSALDAIVKELVTFEN